MKFSCEKDVLQSALDIVSRAVPSKTTNPAMLNVKIESAEGENKIHLTGTNQELTIKTSAEADVINHGETLIGAKDFLNIVKKLSKKNPIVVQTEGMQVIITNGKTRFDLPTVEVEQFPPEKYATDESGVKVETDAFTLKDMIEGTAFAASPNHSNKVLTGELFKVTGKNLRIAALDLIRVAVKDTEIIATGDTEAIIPVTTMNEVSKLLPSMGDVTVNVFKNRVIFDIGDITVISRTIDGNFFKIEQMTDKLKMIGITVEIDRLELYECFDRASLVQQIHEKMPTVMNIKGNSMNVSIKSSTIEFSDDLAVEKQGEDITIGLNSKYVTDALNKVPDAKVKLSMSNAKSPLYISGEGYIYLILPINI